MSRARVWTFITYPESMPDDWENQIEESCIPWVTSPLHDMDLVDIKNPDEGYKKPHFHHMILFSQVKSYKQVQEIVSFLNGPTAVGQVHSVSAMIRYFVHADHKKKAQYPKADIKEFNGADIENLWIKNDKEIFNKLNHLLSLIRDNDIDEFCSFVDYVRKNEADDFYLVVQNQYFISNYIKSIRFAAGRT